MKNSAIIFLFILLGCAGLPVEIDYKAFPETKDVVAIRQARYISHTAADLTFEIDLYHLRGYDYGHFVSPIYFYNDYLDSTFFKFSANGGVKFLSAATAKASSIVPSSAVILADESGSYDSLDRFNSRTQGIVKLCQDFESPSQYLLGGFSKNGSLSDQPADFIQSGFNSYREDQLPLIFNLTTKTGGKSNLYDAINSGIDKLTSVTANKSIILLARTEDEVSASTLNSVVTKAMANQVQLHVLFIGDVTKVGNLPKLAEITGGIFISCPSIKELMCAFENLYSMLSGLADVYRIRIRIKPTSGGVSSGQEFLYPVQISDPLYKINYNSTVVYIKVP